MVFVQYSTQKISLNNGATLSGITGIETQRQDANVVGFNMKADPNDPNPTTWVYGVSPYWVINANTSNTAFVSTTGSLFTEWTLSLKNDLSFTGGVGASNMKITLHDRFNLRLRQDRQITIRNITTWSLRTLRSIKCLTSMYRLYASYSKGYKAPVSSYFFITTPAVTTPATPATGE
jgi:iron complex outermembrane receptor protein